MTKELLAWLCNALDLEVLWVTADGVADLEDSPASDPAELVRQRTGCGVDPDTLAELLEAARRGQPGSTVLSAAAEAREHVARRLLVCPTGSDDIALLCVPAVRAHVPDLAAGVAHELANALNAIAGWARLAQQGGQVAEALDVIERSATTGGAAARHMLSELGGSEAGSQRPERIDAGELVRDVARLIAPTAKRAGVAVRADVHGQAMVRGIRSELWTLLWNLALNGVQAMANSGGELRMRVQRAAGAPDTRAQVVIEVEDDGPGMAPELRARAMEPYFTTKPGGSGVGLALVQRAAQRLDGKLELESQPGLGTRARIRLPAAPASQRQAIRAALGQQRPSSGVFAAAGALEARILVVDDDAGMRDLMATALSMRGIEVVTAADLDEALAAPGAFDLAIIDMLLPHVSGDAVLARLRASGRVRDALMVTGTDAPVALTPGGAPQGWLRKPFQLDDLYERVRELLVQEPAARPAVAT